MGLKPAAHHKLLIQALQELAEGKIDCFAARLSQSNPRLDIVSAMVSGAHPRRPPRACAERPGPIIGIGGSPICCRGDLASRLLAEADPTRGLDCGYNRGNA